MTVELHDAQEAAAPREPSANAADALAALEKGLAEAAAEEAPAPEPKAAEPEKPAAAEPEPEAKGEEPAKADEPPAETKPPENRIAAAMAKRREAQQQREAEQRSKEPAKPPPEDYEARERKIAEREAAMKERLRNEPIKALRELGIDPKEFFEKSLEDPKAADPLQTIKAEVEALKRELAERDSRSQEAAKQAEARAHEANMNAAKVQFVNGIFASAEKFPHLTALFDGRGENLAEEALAIAREYTARTGEYAGNSELAEFLEGEYAKRYNSMKSRLERAGSEASQPAGGNVSLTSKETSAKTTRTKKAVSEMTASERRSAALKMIDDELRLAA